MTKERTVAMLPAQPGWSVAILIEGKPPAISHHQIIAWDVVRTEEPYGRDVKRPRYETCVAHDVEPITAEGNMRHWGNRWGIKQPDGRIEFEGDYFDDEADLAEGRGRRTGWKEAFR